MGKRLMLILALVCLAVGCGGNLSQQKLDELEKLPLDDRIGQLEGLMAEHPQDYRVPALLSRAVWETYEQDDKLAKAEALKADLRDEPENAILSKLLGDAFYDIALGASGVGYLDSALFAYENAALKNPSFLAAVGSAGAIYDEQEDFDQAIYWYKRALEIDSEHVPTLCNLGASHYNKGEYETAMDLYRRALAIDPSSQDAHYNLGVAFAEAQIYQEAVREWEIVAAIDSTTSVGQQAQQNARLLKDVLEETLYEGGRKRRRVDMPSSTNPAQER